MDLDSFLVSCQLKDSFGLERHRAKTLEGLLTRLAAKVAAYTSVGYGTYSASIL